MKNRITRNPPSKSVKRGRFKINIKEKMKSFENCKVGLEMTFMRKAYERVFHTQKYIDSSLLHTYKFVTDKALKFQAKQIFSEVDVYLKLLDKKLSVFIVSRGIDLKKETDFYKKVKERFLRR